MPSENFYLELGIVQLISYSLGQFNMLSIQLSFSCITYPALLLAYLGQGARLIVDGESVISNVFYRTIPGPVNGPLFWYENWSIVLDFGFFSYSLFQDHVCLGYIGNCTCNRQTHGFFLRLLACRFASFDYCNILSGTHLFSL